MKIVRVETTDGTITYGHRADGETFAIDGLIGGEFTVTDRALDVARTLAPVAAPMVFAIGLNYRQHAIETGKEVPQYPVVFAKAVTSVIAAGEPIVIPTGSTQVDYECELAVIIGRACKNVTPEEADSCILGYTVANDVSERFWQQTLGQWVRAKSFDTFCPLGPWIETEIEDPQKLALSTTVNGRTLQDSSTADMIFPVRDLVSFLSQGLTLLPGTVILTGTPPGVGVAREPQVFLQPGDTVSVRVDGVGELTNPVVLES
jgi:2-keto-4-pentenoate hydratase/2-oxohepta-3-ene-1,7-dioic acid hydratase in catechol pathway